jgi:hypothetical protein
VINESEREDDDGGGVGLDVDAVIDVCIRIPGGFAGACTLVEGVGMIMYFYFLRMFLTVASFYTKYLHFRFIIYTRME